MAHNSIGEALPEEFLSRLQALTNPANYERVVAALSGMRPTTLRTNTLKISSSELADRLRAQDFEVVQNPWYADSFTLKNLSLRALSETSEYKEGLLYVQSFSSMLPPLILHPTPGEHVLDIAAAPGSKTTQMAMLMENRGEIVTNDTSRERTYRLIGNLGIQGVTIARTKRADARSIWQQYPEYFDKTLVDVPCSMEGRFNAMNPKSYHDWSLKKVKDLSRMQRWILRSAISATKPGGYIVYATCTISPEENEEVIDWVLAKEKGNVIIEPFNIAGLPADPPVLTWGAKEYNAAIGDTVRIYPNSIMEGFYIAKLKKIRSNVR